LESEISVNRGKRVVFAGLARDCAHALVPILAAIEELGAAVDDWGYVFLENNSVDATPRLLQAFDRRHGRGIVQSMGDLDSAMPLRTERLARLRNRCLEEIFADARLSSFDFLIVLDMDRVNEIIDRPRLLHLMGCQVPQWTGIFANQQKRYYDIWALRHPTWSPDDCWKRVRLRPLSMSQEDAVAEFVQKRMIRLAPDSGFVQVASAFGGLGLYRLQALRSCRYRGVDEDGHEICEHVALHAALADRGARLYIDSALLNGSGDQGHNKGMSLFTRWKRSFKNRARRWQRDR
jgi:hypothetical protein